MIEIVQASSAEQIDAVRQLFSEYFEWIRADLRIDLGYQNIEAELAALPGYFTPPSGRLLLAKDGGLAAGCVALRPMEEGACEMKRMYVRPAYRQQGLGRLLGQAVIDEAKVAGYRLIRLDTKDSLTTARRLYTSLGFHEVCPYYQVPPDVLRWTIFMEMPLA
jgi:putative acetyltransferase